MSVLIKGMEMPKSCFECPIVRDCRGAASYRRIGIDDDCLLVDVPTPHGRLIDADELGEIEDETAYIILDKAPTIIEAEE